MPQTSISFEQLSKYFHLPINDVAKELGICATMLKKICRRNGIPRWPHRKIKSLNKMIENLESSLQNNASEAEDCIKQEINILKNKKTLIMKNPSILAAGSGTKRSPNTPLEVDKPVKRLRIEENESPMVMTKVSPSAPTTAPSSLSINQLLTPSNPFATPLTSYLDPEEDARAKNAAYEHHSSSPAPNTHWQSPPTGYGYPPHGYSHTYVKNSYQQHTAAVLNSRPVSPPPPAEYGQRNHLAYITTPHSGYGAPSMDVPSYTLPKMNMPPPYTSMSGGASPPSKYTKADHADLPYQQYSPPEHTQYGQQHYKSPYRPPSPPPHPHQQHSQHPQHLQQQQQSASTSPVILRWVMEYDKHKK